MLQTLTISRRGALLGGVGAACVLVRSAVSQPPPVSNERALDTHRAQGVGAVTTVKIRPNERIFVDLSRQLAEIDDTNAVAVSMSTEFEPGMLTATIWTQRDMTAGDHCTQVRRALLENFSITSRGGQPGGDIGALELTGYSGPHGTGALKTFRILFECDAAPPVTWDMGELTRAFEGGMPLHAYFPDSRNLSIATQSTAGQFDIVRSADGSVSRLVLGGKTYGGPPSHPLKEGVAAKVTLRDSKSGSTHNVRITPVRRRLDVAPNPTGFTGLQTGVACAPDNFTYPVPFLTGGTQLSRAARYFTGAGTWSFGDTLLCEDGDYDPHNLAGGNRAGFIAFGTGVLSDGRRRDGSRISAPSGPFKSRSGNGVWTYSPGVGVDDGWITVTGRSPRGARLGAVQFSVALLKRSPQSQSVGLRLTNVELGGADAAFQPWFDSAGGLFDMVMVDRCYIRAGGPRTRVQLGNNGRFGASQKGFFFLFNYCEGNAFVGARDIKVIGNRFSKKAGVQDTFDHVALDSDPLDPRCEVLFNLFIDGEGLPSGNHEDNVQLQPGAFYVGQQGVLSICRYAGNIIWRGSSRGSGGKGILGSGTGFFLSDLSGRPGGPYMKVLVCGNVYVDGFLHGVSVTSAGAGTRINYNTLIKDYSVSQWAGGQGASPQIAFLTAHDARHNAIGTGDGSRNIHVRANFCTALVNLDPNTFPQFGSDNVVLSRFEDGRSWVEHYFLDPTMAGRARDVSDIVNLALAYRPGRNPHAGATCDRGLIDHERHSLDWTRLAA